MAVGGDLNFFPVCLFTSTVGEDLSLDDTEFLVFFLEPRSEETLVLLFKAALVGVMTFEAFFFGVLAFVLWGPASVAPVESTDVRGDSFDMARDSVLFGIALEFFALDLFCFGVG